MVKLSINVNKIALLRNSREGQFPNVLDFATSCLLLGAHGITVHPRPDGRHIREYDVSELSKKIREQNEYSHARFEFNIEGFPTSDFIKKTTISKPDQATLVPDPPEVLTSNEGWKVIANQALLKEVVAELKSAGIRVSLFMDAENYSEFELLKELGVDRIELYTGNYAKQFVRSPEGSISKYIFAAKHAHSLGLGINAGHDLNTHNLAYFERNIPHLLEVSIGHAFVADCLYWGLPQTMQMYLRCLGY